MKTAEEVMKLIVFILEAQPNQRQFADATAALTVFAEERMKEALDRDDREVFNSARAEALEEARIKTLCNQIPAGSEDFQDGWVRACEFIDEEIRALKEKA